MVKLKQKPKQKLIYIYCFYFPKSRKRYIGQTYNLKRRIVEHLKSDYLVGRALRKYDNYKFSILHTTKSKVKANRLEIAAIAAHNSIAPNGYNLKPGGEGGNIFSGKTKEEIKVICKKISEAGKGNQYLLGFHHTEETRKLMSKNNGSRRPEVAAKISKAMKGKKHSEETKKKVSKSLKGNQYSLGFHHTEETRKLMSKNNPMKRPEIVAKVVKANIGKKRSVEAIEKTAASRMKITVKQYKKQKRKKLVEQIAKDKVKLAQLKKLEPILQI